MKRNCFIHRENLERNSITRCAKMAKTSGVLSSHLFAALFLASVVLVKGLPTSVLVDSKQQQQLHHQQHDQIEQQPSSTSGQTLNKGKF